MLAVCSLSPVPRPLTMVSTVRRMFIAKPLGWREAAILVAVAWLVPFLIHLIPWSGPRPLGVYTLPIFWTTFLAVYFYGALPGLAIGLVSPLVNLALTGLPALRSVGMMGMEVALFVGVAVLLTTRWPGFWIAAPLAWVAAKALAIGIQFLIPAFDYTGVPLAHLWRSTQNGLIGLGMLAVINWLLAAFYPKSDAWERE
jgi:hypothetical protein